MDNISKIGKLILREFAEKWTVNIAFVINIKTLADGILADEHYVLLELERLSKDEYIRLIANGENWTIILFQEGLNAGRQEVQE